MLGMNKYVWEYEKNRLISFVRNHTKLNGNRLQAAPFVIHFNLPLNKGKSKEIYKL